jgi:hypothetical protein
MRGHDDAPSGHRAGTFSRRQFLAASAGAVARLAGGSRLAGAQVAATSLYRGPTG